MDDMDVILLLIVVFLGIVCLFLSLFLWHACKLVRETKKTISLINTQLPSLLLETKELIREGKELTQEATSDLRKVDPLFSSIEIASSHLQSYLEKTHKKKEEKETFHTLIDLLQLGLRTYLELRREKR